MNTQTINKNKNAFIILLVTIAIATLVISFVINANQFAAEENSSNGLVNPRPTPPPLKLSMWGELTASDAGKRQLGYERFSMPMNLPDGALLQATRVLTSEDGTYRQLTEFYGPDSIDISDSAILDDFLANGGMMILYIEDDLKKPFDWKNLGPEIVKESPETLEMGKINGVDALIVKGDASQKARSEMQFDIGKTRVALISNSYDVTKLTPIAQSIRG